MKYVIKTLIIFFIFFSKASLSEGLYEKTLREAALKNGFEKPENINQPFDDEKASLGKIFFEEKLLSFNTTNSCSSCHLNKFSSGDQLPNAVGSRGHGEGFKRMFSGGDIVPRNTLPLWGRGGKDFDVLFWDGKVMKKDGKVISQLGVLTKNYISSESKYKINVKDDALLTAVHLPFVEIRELVSDDEKVEKYFKKENINSALNIYNEVLSRVKTNPDYLDRLKTLYNVHEGDLEFHHIADSIVHFIRRDFAIKPTKFSKFVFDKKSMSNDELRGGLIFYGKGKCATCHSGKYFSDFSFHAIAFPQIGFGKNGFGVDYGKFNSTLDPKDLYKFRTPPLYNVEKTFPYSHSGSVYNLDEAIIYHYDPLRFYNNKEYSDIDRVEFYKRLTLADRSVNLIPYLDKIELKQLVKFLKTLSF